MWGSQKEPGFSTIEISDKGLTVDLLRVQPKMKGGSVVSAGASTGNTTSQHSGHYFEPVIVHSFTLPGLVETEKGLDAEQKGDLSDTAGIKEHPTQSRPELSI